MFRILIVDDDKNSRRYYHAILSHSGYQPICADSASIALHMLEEKKIDLLLIPPSPSSTGLSDEKLALVKGEVIDFSKTDREPFEDIEFSFLPICKVKEMLSKPDKYTFSFNGRLSILFLISQLENKI